MGIELGGGAPKLEWNSEAGPQTGNRTGTHGDLGLHLPY
jgi:hypothetical protein